MNMMNWILMSKKWQMTDTDWMSNTNITTYDIITITSITISYYLFSITTYATPTVTNKHKVSTALNYIPYYKYKTKLKKLKLIWKLKQVIVNCESLSVTVSVTLTESLSDWLSQWLSVSLSLCVKPIFSYPILRPYWRISDILRTLFSVWLVANVQFTKKRLKTQMFVNSNTLLLSPCLSVQL